MAQRLEADDLFDARAEARAEANMAGVADAAVLQARPLTLLRCHVTRRYATRRCATRVALRYVMLR